MNAANQDQDQIQRSLTFGEKAVGLTFNPSGDTGVNTVKTDYAKIIDHMHHLRSGSASNEQKRYASTAITLAEQAQMMSVKALMWKD